MHDSEPVWVATPSLYESFIHNTLPALTGALNNKPVERLEHLEPLERLELWNRCFPDTVTSDVKK